MSRPKVIQATDTDALSSKLSAADAGYFNDDLLHLFLADPVPAPASVPASSTARKLPLINRGTYVRQSSVSRLVDQFLAAGNAADGTGVSRQIVSLGAGSDTRPFHIFSGPLASGLVYHEIDFPASALRKARIIASSDVLSSLIPGDVVYELQPARRASPSPIQSSRTQPPPSSLFTCPLASPSYYIHGLDLNHLSSPSAVVGLPGYNPALPTLILSECCLCYLDPAHADSVLSSFLRARQTSPYCPDVGFVSYEPFANSDSFGKVMIHNLATRGISIPAMIAYPSLPTQLARAAALGFTSAAAAADMRFIHDTWLDQRDQARIDRLEILDEREEFDLLASHYGIYWALSSGHTNSNVNMDKDLTNLATSFTGLFSSWNDLPHQI
ncbi:S-adenosyl-L-methionine-dependent methyltransferase [Lipomyces oligophaga]|uniref:S-adenosyl-L-methionine-dependent methyltransferase n=1 Tax=Lipomyces oligophaga TaxID=45792 RepID=UPI0034CE5006